MIHSFLFQAGKMQEVEGVHEEALYIDVLNATQEEKKAIHEKFQIILPRQEKIGRYGSSSTYKKGDALIMTAVVLAKMKTDQKALSPVTFIVHPKFFMTVRTSEPSPFGAFKKRLLESEQTLSTQSEIFVGLIEAIYNRIAEITEKIDFDIDSLSQEIFLRGKSRVHTKKLGDLLTRLGNKGDLASKISESTRSIERVLNYYLLQKMSEKRQEIDILQQNLHSILDHLHFLANKISFLLDACLGFISIEQNNIIKIFTILAMLLLPPSLIATLYGMNFKYMPELDWHFGYPFALTLMLVSALLPYFYFKRKGWL